LITLPADQPHSSAAPPPRLSRTVEAAFLLSVCGVLFFLGVGRFDFIKTEGLRAIVVAEMLEQPGISMPSVHHRAYLKKPPLYAWCTTLLAQAAGRFDEQIARLPSALAGTALILLLYGVAEGCIGRGAGVPTAALALANVTVIDYAVRAELDMGFAFLTTASILLAYPALHRRAVVGVLCWMGCYLLATLAALWKGPHSLIFLWALLLAYGWRKRRWSWLWHPGQVCGLLVSLGVLIAWALTLSTHAGTASVGRTAGIELVSRLVPLSLGDLLSILYAVPIMAVVVLPASLFVAASFRSGVVYQADDAPNGRSLRAIVSFCTRRSRRWWTSLAADPFTEFLLFWIGANLVWTAIVPAKSPRYWLPMFGPVFLLAGCLLCRRLVGAAGQTGRRHLDLTWRGIYAVLGVIGLLALLAAAATLISPGLTIAATPLGPAWAWLAMAIGWMAIAIVEFSPRIAPSTIGRCLGLIVVVLAVKPVLSNIWWPARARSDSQRGSAALIDQQVPPGEPVFVLGGHELPDVAFYSARPFQWLDEPADAADFTTAPFAFYLLRDEDLEEQVAGRGFRYDCCLEFDRADKQVVLIRIDSIPKVSQKQL